MTERIIISVGGRFVAIIVQDEMAENPREMFDHDTTIVYHSSRYVLGDVDIVPEDFELPDNVWAFPVYAYIHSGTALSLSREVCAFDPQGWDSGQSGIMYISRGCVASEEEAYHLCKAELAEFEAYINGETYGYRVYRMPDGTDPLFYDLGLCEEVEAVWGFYGYESAEAAANEAIEQLEATTPKWLSLFA